MKSVYVYVTLVTIQGRGSNFGFLNLNCFSQWVIDNKLSLHLGKPESILFVSPQKFKCNPSLEITCNNLAIKSTTSVDNLGAALDQTLSFSEMAQSLLKKANARLKFFLNMQPVTAP